MSVRRGERLGKTVEMWRKRAFSRIAVASGGKPRHFPPFSTKRLWKQQVVNVWFTAGLRMDIFVVVETFPVCAAKIERAVAGAYAGRNVDLWLP